MTKKQLELENARLRGQVQALETILAAMRNAQTPPAPWPFYPPMPTLPTYPLQPLPDTIPIDTPRIVDHGGMCACPQCVPGTICGDTTWFDPSLVFKN